MSVRAFDLVPAIERAQLISDKAKTEITCIECCGKNLYIGTGDCLIIHYIIEEKIGSNGKIHLVSEKQGYRHLALKKPVSQLKAASALNRILVLCDNMLVLLNMFDLEPILSGTRIKNVVSFCLNENPIKSNPFSIEICVSLKKKCLQIYKVTEDKMTLIRDVSTTDIPITMCIDGTFICTALPTQYYIINYVTGGVQDLFPYDSNHVRPIITRITREEFLLSAPGALGMFASASGTSQRPPLQWSENLVSVIYSHPYCLALNDEFITVHSILDQQQKQSIPFQGGQHLGEFDGKIFVASAQDIYALIPIPVEKQIQALLVDKRVKEALDLAQVATKTGIDKEKFLKMYQRIQLQAGFIEFSEMNFDEAQKLFRSGRLDVREMIAIYPHLLATSSRFVKCLPPLHDIADIVQLCRGEEDRIIEYKRFLISYLEEIHGTRHTLGAHMEIDTALVKLYAELKPDELPILVASDCACDVGDCIPYLEKHNRHHMLALLHSSHGDHDRALGIWTKLIKTEMEDESFPGVAFMVEYLTHINNSEMVWKYADFLLEKDQLLGVKIFIDRSSSPAQSEDELPSDQVVDYLSRYPVAVVKYLEHLVFECKSEVEKYHTHLSVLYLDSVIRLMKDTNTQKEELDKARSELCRMLQTSSHYRIQLILGKVTELELYPECAILYGKLEEHDKALGILVHKLRDFDAAENYCIVNAKDRDLNFRKRLFQVLLSIYLDPNNERRDSFVAPAVALLNNNKADFDMIKVLQVIPDHWSIGLLSRFLTSSVRKATNRYRMTHIQRMLARGENLQLKSEHIELLRDGLKMTDDKLCAVCGERFSEVTFVRYPNGIMTHTSCAPNKYICPVTGKLFSATQGTALPSVDHNHDAR
ncbi:hypothetical protein LSH36_779g02008 [Paralvinella palmiformis]|uniref:CNH domain-containing protein n=1 Tax=Paralvinella palmiformis TaxID=53620 RepID=A0AAD9J157_9ANNE|nr:hypothetical protein LSH36_779g02008 [Paralvinella palmiformis]